MNFIISFLAYIICIPLFIAWLIFCAGIATIGIFISKKHILINLDRVKKKETICQVLNTKGLISNKEYSFETDEVAPLYDELTFRGYLFVLNPIIFLLKHTDFTNTFVVFLVNKWMNIHHFQNQYKKDPNTYFSAFAKLCVVLAGNVGQVLYRFKY